MISSLLKMLLPVLLSGQVITKISYSKTGGRGGDRETLDITRSYISYEQSEQGKEKKISERTSPGTWKKFTTSINLRDFDRVKTNPGHAMYDGIDYTISIVANSKEHTLVNGNEDYANYNKLGPFTILIRELLGRLRKKAAAR
jgi:hypothetical protein